MNKLNPRLVAKAFHGCNKLAKPGETPYHVASQILNSNVNDFSYLTKNEYNSIIKYINFYTDTSNNLINKGIINSADEMEVIAFEGKEINRE